MYAIRLPNGEFLDTSANFQLDYELNNQVFTSAGTISLAGSYTFPTDIPASDTNRRLLSNAQLIQNRYKFRSIPDCIIYCHGLEMFTGELRITDAAPGKYRITVIVNPVKPIKEIGLNALDLGGERGAGGFDENMATFAATAERPEEWDYALYPVYAPEFDAQQADIVDNDYINWWRDEDYTFSIDSVALIPFPTIDYVLRRIFEQLVPDYAFINAWQISHELRRLYLLNNFDSRINLSGSLSTAYQIDLRNHVSDMKCNEFLKAIMLRFCLGLFSSPFSKRIVLRPLRDIVRAPARIDWSAWVLNDYNITDDQPDTPMKFCDPQFEDRTDRVGDEIDLPSFSSLQEFQSALGSLDDGLYYVEAIETIYEVSAAYGAPQAFFWGRKRRCVVLDDSPEIEASLAPPGAHDFPAWGHFPWYEQTGSYWQNDGTDASPQWVRYMNQFDLQLMFYRGFQQATGAVIHERPYASADVWRPDAKPLPLRAKITDKAAGPSGAYTTYGDAQYSLLWAGQYGLFEQWWRPWHDLLRSGKHVTRRFTLPVSAVRAFSFEEKVRIHNVEYFVKRLRVSKSLENGLVLVEANMITCV